MRKLLILALLLALLIAALPVITAQDESAPACDDPAALAATYTEQLATITTLDELQAIQHSIASDLAACNGFVWEGTGNQVFGPIEIEAGKYIFNYDFKKQEGDLCSFAAINAQLEPTEGNEFINSVTEVVDVDKTGQSLQDIEGGEYLFSITSNCIDWTFELVKP